MKFISKPTIIDAVQFHALGDHFAVGLQDDHFVVRTASGLAAVKPGDWIAAEPNGDGYYPINPDVLAIKYQPMEEGEMLTVFSVSPEGEAAIRDLFNEGFNAVAEMRA